MNLFIEFPPVSSEEWEAAARADLKGRDPATLGKILYGPGDVVDRGEQPWPARSWQIWAEVADLAGARRALDRGAEGLVVRSPGPDWLEVLQGVHVHTESELGEWASGLRGTLDRPAVPSYLPRFQTVEVMADQLSIAEQVRMVAAFAENGSAAVARRLGMDETVVRAHPMSKVLDVHFVMPVGPSYFEEIAKFRALRRLCPHSTIIARTSRWHTTAYDPHVNLLRGTTEAMAAIIGGCDALIVGPFTEARGFADEFAERLALNTQLLLRDESYFGQVADPAAGSWYIESLTAAMLNSAFADAPAKAFVGVNRYPSVGEASPEAVTQGRAMSALEQCRLRSERALRRPTVRFERGADEKMSRARAAFSREFFAAGGFQMVESGVADLIVLCDADANYPSAREWPVLAAGPDFNRNSDHAAVIAAWLDRMGIA